MTLKKRKKRSRKSKIVRKVMFELLNYFWHGKAHNELEQKFSAVNLKADDSLISETRLPTLVAHGDESSGKSTLLANMIQFDMFDIGKDMITRMVWVYRLRYSPTQKIPRIIVKVGKRPQLETTDPAAVRNLIAEVHAEIGQSIVDQEGYIEIYSNTVPKMDIYDLPGAVAVKKKNEPATLVETSRRIAKKYLTRPDHIVLHVQSSVSPSRSSVAAGLLDELKCERKITVFTKVDCAVHQHTALRDFVEMFSAQNDNAIAVSNYQSQPEMSFTDIREEEHKLFVDNLSPTDYDTLKHRLGISSLLQRINVLAEQMNGAEWAKVQIRAEQGKLGVLQAQLKALGPSLKTHDICQIVSDGVIGQPGFLEHMMRDTWDEMKFNVPSTMDIWTKFVDVDGSRFFNAMNLKIVNQLNHVFEFSPAMLHRFETFCTDYRRLLTTRLANRNAPFSARWSKFNKFLTNEFLTASPAYTPERWFHTICGCYIQQVLMKLNDVEELDANNYKPSNFLMMHFGMSSQPSVGALTVDEREVGPPPNHPLKAIFEALGADLSCEEALHTQKYRASTQEQIEVVTSVIQSLTHSQ